MSSMMIRKRQDWLARASDSAAKVFSSGGLSGKKRLVNAADPATSAPIPPVVANATALPITGPA